MQVDSTHPAKQVIDYIPGPVALEAHQSAAQVKLAWGPLGTSKTTWLCWRIAYLAQVAARAGYSLRALLVRDTYRNLADSTLQTWLHWFPEGAAGHTARSDPVDYKLFMGGRYHDVLFRHGQTEQDASMFLSTEYDFIGLEEIAPAYLPGGRHVSPGIAEGVFDMAYSRLTREIKRAAAIGPELAMTCNSPPLTHWASTRIIDRDEDYLEKLHWAHWMFPVADNAHNLRPDYYSNLEMAWEGKRALIKRFLQGERIAVFVGIPRFNIDALDRLLNKTKNPTFRGWLTPTEDNMMHVRLEANPEGWIRIWQRPQHGARYVIGADAAAGLEGGDYSSAHVLNTSDLSIAAVFHGHLEPSRFADELAKIGFTYNRALIGIETEPSAHGLSTATKLRDGGYPRMYYTKQLASRSKRAIERIGWLSTQGTKRVLIDSLAAYLDDGGKLVDKDTIAELMTYGVMENGQMEAQDGCFDDRVISMALAIYLTHHAGLAKLYPSLN